MEEQEEQRKVKEGLIFLLEYFKKETEKDISHEVSMGIISNLRKFKNCVDIISRLDSFGHSEYEKWRGCYKTTLESAGVVLEKMENYKKIAEELIFQ